MKSALLSTVSHELRTPLTSIRALSELLADHEFDPPEVAVLAGTINRESERLGRLVQNVLDAARVEAGVLPNHPRPVAPRTVVEEALALPRALEPNRQFTIDFAPDLPKVATDPDRLRQVLDNLLSNALKYSPPEAPITICARQEGAVVRLTVQDQGLGVPLEQQPLLFRRFAGGRQQTGGVGLGLYLSRQLMTLLGGDIGVQSSPGRGAAFWITLPVAAP